MTALTRSATDRLHTDFRGQLITPGDDAYDAARRVWNGAIDRYPALIARASGTSDVITAVRFARERELPVSIRGGGHSAAGHAVADGALMIDLSAMKATRIDPAGRTAMAGAGLLVIFHCPGGAPGTAFPRGAPEGSCLPRPRRRRPGHARGSPPR